MAAPTAASLRALVGLLGCSATTSTSTNRGLRSLQGAQAASDVDVQSVVNALVDALDAMPVARGKASIEQDVISYTTLTAGTETAWSMDVGSGTAATYLFDFDICGVSDDMLDAAAYKVLLSVQWDGAAAAAIAAAHAPVSDETAPAVCACTADVSGTTVRLRVGGTADWRYGGSVRITKVGY